MRMGEIWRRAEVGGRKSAVRGQLNADVRPLTSDF
jgi:hypothetical protein